MWLEYIVQNHVSSSLYKTFLVLIMYYLERVISTVSYSYEYYVVCRTIQLFAMYYVWTQQYVIQCTAYTVVCSFFCSIHNIIYCAKLSFFWSFHSLHFIVKYNKTTVRTIPIQNPGSNRSLFVFVIMYNIYVLRQSLSYQHD